MKSVSRRFITVVLILVISCSMLFYITQKNVASMTASLAERPVTVMIDAGHGGEDGGAISISGVKESSINLSVARRLDQLLFFMGYPTSMIRTSDQAVSSNGETIAERKASDLKRRVEMIRSIEPALVVSIHQNHFSESRYSGAQVFYAKSPGSKALAGILQHTIAQVLDPNNTRVCKQAASVYLMEHISCPGVLIECGFLSNPEEEQKLQHASYQKKLSCAITLALSQYLSEGDHSLEV